MPTAAGEEGEEEGLWGGRLSGWWLDAGCSLMQVHAMGHWLAVEWMDAGARVVWVMGGTGWLVVTVAPIHHPWLVTC